MRKARFGVVAVFAVILVFAPAARAQAPAEPGSTTAAEGQQLKRPPAAPAPTLKAGVQRWFDVQTASFMARYRRIESTAGQVTSNHLQDSIAFRARFKFDPKGKYAISAGVATGTSFTGGWNNTGLGAKGAGDDRVMKLFVKQLFFTAAPIKGVELAAGGLGVARGESTEITSYDNDGFLMGERVSLKRPAEAYFDEISFTNAHLGDINTPNVFDRYRRLDEPNYRQMLVAKRLRNWLVVSGDYTRLAGVGTMRAAVTAKTPGARVVDLVRYEEYRRMGTKGAYGFAAYGEKALIKRLTVGAGFADIDANYGGLNADRFNKGRRWFGQSTVKLTSDLSASLFVTKAAHNTFAVANRTRVDVVVTYNAMGPLQRAGLFR